MTWVKKNQTHYLKAVFVPNKVFLYIGNDNIYNHCIFCDTKTNQQILDKIWTVLTGKQPTYIWIRRNLLQLISQTYLFT